KHSDDKNVLRNAEWQSLSLLPAPKCTPETQAAGKHFYVKLGYIAWDAAGVQAFTVPIDRMPFRNVTISAMYKVKLRTPKLEPFPPGNNPMPAKEEIPAAVSSTEAIPPMSDPELEELLETQEDDDGYM
ncbi:MAG: hypothetical protein QXT77_09155, partial [Candidatus Methanomethylicaceae archaeon]